jgi:type IV secretory pathway VirB3-like protein
MRWAQRLKRVFGIDIETCAACGGAMRIIACIEDPVVIKAILAHLAAKAHVVEFHDGRVRMPMCASTCSFFIGTYCCHENGGRWRSI